MCVNTCVWVVCEPNGTVWFIIQAYDYIIYTCFSGIGEDKIGTHSGDESEDSQASDSDSELDEESVPTSSTWKRQTADQIHFIPPRDMQFSDDFPRFN